MTTEQLDRRRYRREPLGKDQIIKFAEVYLAKGNATAAYREAFPNRAARYGGPGQGHADLARKVAHTMLKGKRVQAAIKELQERMVENSGITLERLTEMAMAAYKKATEEDYGSSAMVKAVAQLSKMYGLDTRERENDLPALSIGISTTASKANGSSNSTH